MAYQGGYGGGGGAGAGASQRSYAGPAAQRPAAREAYGEDYTQQPYGARQPYNDYNGGYSYESRAGAYQDDASQHYRDQYGPGPGTGAGPTPSYARGGGGGAGGGGGQGGRRGGPGGRGRGGGPPARPVTSDGPRRGNHPPRGMGPGPGRGLPPRGGGPPGGRGGGRPEQYPPVDYSGQPPLPNQTDATYGGHDQDQQLAGQMSGMDLNAQRPRGLDEYGRPMAGRGRGQHAGYAESRQGVPPGGAHYAGYDGGYNGPQSPTSHDLGPSRSMTMPAGNPGPAYNAPPPPPPGTGPFLGVGDMGSMPPPRPSTAGSHRPPPRRIYPPGQQGVSQGHYGGGNSHEEEYGNSPGPPGPGPGPVAGGPAHAPFSEGAVGSYYGGPRVGGPDRQPSGYAAHSGQSAFSDFDFRPDDDGSRPYDQAFRGGAAGQPQPGAHGTPRLHHARSEANFHEPQAAVFEMAGDIPSVPPVPQTVKPYQPEYNQWYGETPAEYDDQLPPPRGSTAPPGAVHDARQDFMGGSGMSRYNPNPVATTPIPPDSLASHPTPVRPGLMPNSMVYMNDRPPPVRNYSGVMQPPAGQAQQYGQARPPHPPHPPQQQQLQQQQQQQQQQQYEHYQQPPPVQGAYPPPVEPDQMDEPVTPQQLERLRMAIKVNANDQDSALKLAKKLIEAADLLAPRLPDPKQRAKARERYLMDAHKVLKKLSTAQNQEAMYTLADSLGRGLFGHEPDTKEAFTLYQSAAKLGHAQAAYRTAVCCEIGHEDGGGTRKDPLKAMQWYKRAATLGDPPAMYKVGMILLKGLLGQARNPREAVGWLKHAAERADRENPHALHELGLLYESAQPNDGGALPRDERQAFALFQQAAALGYKYSEFRLGLAFERGHLGVEKDDRQSIYWYSLAAQQEEHQSELALAGWYLTGSPDVLNQSDTEAYLWARKAAVSGLAKAEYAMGYLTEMGIGVAANLEDAKRWYWRAAAQDLHRARDRLEELKRVGRNAQPRRRERMTRSHIERQQDGDCTMM
ncbi:hypothetical protein E4U41_003620 [Claviceps citrina]|nr:hypothetical protein E4U41_003620 [Claviceps citrina]